MNATSVVSGKRAKSPRNRQGRGLLARIAVSAVVWCIALSPLAAQTSSGLPRTITLHDPNSAVSTDPNAVSGGETVSDPNQTLVTDPNQTLIYDPNTVLVVEPNQVSDRDPNEAWGYEPNEAAGYEPNETPAAEPNAVCFNRPGNLLIADQLNHRVIEVDRDAHEVVWQFGDGNSVAGPNSVVAPHDAERVGEWTLICGTGLPAGTEPNSAACAVDSRVLLVDRSGRIIWQYGRTGVAGADANELNMPTYAAFLPYGHILITDQGNHRVLEVSMITKQIVWQHGTTGVAGTGRNYLDSPSSAQWLDNGNILIADQGNNRIIEVSRRHQIAWAYGDSDDPNVLNGPAYASRLPNDHTLITDSGNNRVLEVDQRGRTVMDYAVNEQSGSVADPLVWRAVRLENGNTLISNQFNQQVIEIDPTSNIVFTQGTLGTAGSGFDELNAPCDAKAIGDYTGLTQPSLDSYCDWNDSPEPQDQDWGDGWRARGDDWRGQRYRDRRGR